MAESVQWALELTDKVTPDGKRIVKMLGEIGKGADKVGKVASKEAAKGIESVGRAAVATAAKYLAFAKAWSVGVNLASTGKQLVLDAQGFKDRSGIALSALLKSEKAAASAYGRLVDFAHFFGEDPTEAITRFQNLLAGGWSQRDSEKLMQAFGDLKLVTPTVNTDAIAGAFSTIRAKAKLELADFQAAVSAGGLNLTLAYEAIGKKIGRNAKEVEAIIGSGQVNADVGIIGLLDAINQRTNSSKAGEQLGKFANTTSGMIERLKHLPSQFVMRMTADDSPLKGSLAKVLEYLDPKGPNAGRIIGALNTAFTKIGQTLAAWATPEGMDKIGKGLTAFIDAVPKVVAATAAVSKAVLWIVGAVTSFRDNMRFLWAEVKRGGAVATGFLASIAGVVSPIVGIGVAVVGAANWTINAVKAIGAWFADLAKKAVGFGTAIVDGLWQGLKDAWAGLLKNIKGLLDLLPAAAKKALGIASPSKVFAEIGGFTAEGFGAGYMAKNAETREVMVAAIEDSKRAATAAATTSIGGNTISNVANNRTGPSVGQVHVHVDGGTDDMDRDDFAWAAERGLGRALERAAGW